MTESNGHQPEKIDILIDQVGRLTEGLQELKLIVERQAQTTDRQEQNISRLVGIVEALINDRQNG
jgi:hypothetical protein